MLFITKVFQRLPKMIQEDESTVIEILKKSENPSNIKKKHIVRWNNSR